VITRQPQGRPPHRPTVDGMEEVRVRVPWRPEHNLADDITQGGGGGVTEITERARPARGTRRPGWQPDRPRRSTNRTPRPRPAAHPPGSESVQAWRGQRLGQSLKTLDRQRYRFGLGVSYRLRARFGQLSPGRVPSGHSLKWAEWCTG
jgi:hypothetical protein